MVGLRRRLERTVPLAAALAVLTMLLAPGVPAGAAPSGARMLQPAGHLTVASLGSRPGHGTRPSHLVAPRRVPDPAAQRHVKARAASALQPGSISTTLSGPQAALFNNLDQPGLSVFDESFCCTPADPTGAIGPNHYVEIVNDLVGVYSRSNLGLLSSMDLGAFAAAPSGVTMTDPQIEWNFQANRWFYLAIAFATGNNFVMFGWSKTSDPSDLANGWCRFGVGTGSSLNDFPKLGHDDNYLLFGSNVYDDSQSTEPFITANIWAYAKPAPGDSSCTGTGLAYYFADATHVLFNADGTPADTPVPANTTQSSTGGYIVAAHSPLTKPAGARSRVMVWHMTKQGGLPALVADGDITVNSYDVPGDVPQPQNLLDTLDAQLTQAVARTDPDTGALAIWTQHTIGGPGGRSVVRWYELLPGTLAVRQQGEVSSPTDFIFNGAISPSITGNDAVIEYNRGSSTLTPVIGAQSRQGSTPLGTMDAGEVPLGSSTDVDQDISCSAPYGPPCRWGDYSGATPDPINPGVVWGSNMVNGQSIFGFPQWTTQNFAISTGATVSQDFSLSVAPASQTVTAGAGTSYTVTITPTGGFAGSVTLSLSGLPSGATGSFSPNPATSNSTLAVSTDPSTPAGTYPMTITGTAGILTHTASATLVVNAAAGPDFSLSASPSSQTVTAGAGTSYTVTITPTGGFSDSVTLSLSGLPSGANGSFSPNPATGSSTLSVGTNPSTPAGTYSLTITGTAGSVTHTTSATLVVNAPPDFSLSASPTSRTVGPGVTATSYVVTINPINGFSGSVTLGFAGLPVGAVGGFSPNPTTSASTLNVTINSTTPTGIYVLTISGTSGSLTHSTTVTLVVADFALTASPASVTIAGGQSATYVVTIQGLNGFSGSVSLSLSAVPSKATATFSPNPATSSSILTIKTNRGRTTPGTYTLLITGTSGGWTRTTTVILVIT